MMSEFVKAKFRVGDRVRFPYGRKVGTVRAVGIQVYEGHILGLLYQISSYTLTESQLTKYRPRKVGTQKRGAKP